MQTNSHGSHTVIPPLYLLCINNNTISGYIYQHQRAGGIVLGHALYSSAFILIKGRTSGIIRDEVVIKNTVHDVHI